MEDRVMSAIDFVSRAYHTDPARIYLTGFSMGATSSLYLAARNPHKFAAIVSIAVGITWPGGIEWPPNLAEDENTRQLFRKMFVNDKRAQFIAEQIRDVPAWFFHGALDDACPIDESRQLHAELNKLGTATRLTEYPDLGHVCLNRSFTEAGLFDWLFSHSLALAGYSTN
jgi:dipeptidyl aminopeptidase/acylaminoacyl peptidase